MILLNRTSLPRFAVLATSYSDCLLVTYRVNFEARWDEMRSSLAWMVNDACYHISCVQRAWNMTSYNLRKGKGQTRTTSWPKCNLSNWKECCSETHLTLNIVLQKKSCLQTSFNNLVDVKATMHLSLDSAETERTVVRQGTDVLLLQAAEGTGNSLTLPELNIDSQPESYRTRSQDRPSSPFAHANSQVIGPEDSRGGAHSSGQRSASDSSLLLGAELKRSQSGGSERASLSRTSVGTRSSLRLRTRSFESDASPRNHKPSPSKAKVSPSARIAKTYHHRPPRHRRKNFAVDLTNDPQSTKSVPVWPNLILHCRKVFAQAPAEHILGITISRFMIVFGFQCTFSRCTFSHSLCWTGMHQVLYFHESSCLLLLTPKVMRGLCTVCIYMLMRDFSTSVMEDSCVPVSWAETRHTRS